MSVWVSERECQRLYEFDKHFMWGCAILQQPTLFLARLIPPEKYNPGFVLITDTPRLLHVQNRFGRPASALDFDGMIPIISAWPGQKFGNRYVTCGHVTAMLQYMTLPWEVIQKVNKENARASGREHDRLVKDSAAELDDYAKHLLKKSSDNRKVMTRDEIRAQENSKIGEQIERYRQNDYESSNEYRYQRDNGLL